MKKLMSFAGFCLTAFIIVSLFSCSAQAPKANLKTDIDSLSYAYGVNITQGLDQYIQSMGIDEAYRGEFFKGFLEGSKMNKKNKKAIARMMGVSIGKQVAVDMFPGINENLFGPDSTATQSLNKSLFLSGFLAAAQNKKLVIPKEVTEPYVQAKSAEIQNRANEALKTENLAFLENNKTKEGVKVLPSGLQYKVVKEGTGRKATAEDMVKVKYVGTTIHGKEFDHNDEASFKLDQVIKGWTEGIQLMTVGSKYTLYVPYDLAYGERGRRPEIEPYATLIFDVELLDATPAPPAPPAPKAGVQPAAPVIKK